MVVVDTGTAAATDEVVDGAVTVAVAGVDAVDEGVDDAVVAVEAGVVEEVVGAGVVEAGDVDTADERAEVGETVDAVDTGDAVPDPDETVTALSEAVPDVVDAVTTDEASVDAACVVDVLADEMEVAGLAVIAATTPDTAVDAATAVEPEAATTVVALAEIMLIDGLVAVVAAVAADEVVGAAVDTAVVATAGVVVVDAGVVTAVETAFVAVVVAAGIELAPALVALAAVVLAAPVDLVTLAAAVEIGDAVTPSTPMVPCASQLLRPPPAAGFEA